MKNFIFPIVYNKWTSFNKKKKKERETSKISIRSQSYEYFIATFTFVTFVKKEREKINNHFPQLPK